MNVDLIFEVSVMPKLVFPFCHILSLVSLNYLPFWLVLVSTLLKRVEEGDSAGPSVTNLA